MIRLVDWRSALDGLKVEEDEEEEEEKDKGWEVTLRLFNKAVGLDKVLCRMVSVLEDRALTRPSVVVRSWEVKMF